MVRMAIMDTLDTTDTTIVDQRAKARKTGKRSLLTKNHLSRNLSSSL